MPAIQVHSSSRHRLLPDPGLRTQHPCRHPVVGVLLDQRRRVTSSCIDRFIDRLDHDDHEWRRAGLSAESFLYQGRFTSFSNLVADVT